MESSSRERKLHRAVAGISADMNRAKISDRQPEIVKFAEGLKKDGYERVSLIGYCWGKATEIWFWTKRI